LFSPVNPKSEAKQATVSMTGTIFWLGEAKAAATPVAMLIIGVGIPTVT
jgi:hypothetical protein